MLSDAGKAMLAQARAVSDDVDALVAGVRSFNQGLESELGLALDVMFPTHLVAEVLREFQQVFPTVQLRLHVEALGAIAALVVEGEAELGIGGPELVALPELERVAIGSVELIPVAAPSHALARMETIPPRRGAQASPARADGSLAAYRWARFLGRRGQHLAPRRSGRAPCADARGDRVGATCRAIWSMPTLHRAGW